MNNEGYSLSGNRGEWSEIYIFLKLISDGKIYAADNKMNKLEDTYLDIIKIIREEIKDYRYEYKPGQEHVEILLNGKETDELIKNDIVRLFVTKVWNLMNEGTGSKLRNPEITQFLNTIHVTKLKAPAIKTSDFFGGTQDIVMEVFDYKTHLNSILSFSCKSQNKATLFNASGDNTNFVYRVKGNINDQLMDKFNNIFKYINKTDDKGEKYQKRTIATGERMKFLKDNNLNLVFVDNAREIAKRNLIMSGGIEMPAIVAEMIKYFFYIGEGKVENGKLTTMVKHLAEVDPSRYGFSNLEDAYRTKIGKLLYDMFTGMRLGTQWNGRCDVNGGYVIVKDDGDVLAYHTCIADEFKDFLIENLGLEGCDNGRHGSMQMYKEDGEYRVKFNLQIRFRQ